MRIMGIDPGIATTGYGIIDTNINSCELVCYGVIKTPAKMLFQKRLDEIYKSLIILIEKYKPNEIAVEELFFNNNEKTAIKVSHSRGIIMLACEHKKLIAKEYTPLQIKKGLTGYGRALKYQCMNVVKMLLELSDIPKPDDAADALGVAICHYNQSKLLTHFS